MPTLITTIGGATSNSYISVEDAQLYFDVRLGSEAWMNETNADNKIRALIQAANRLQSENWLGNRVASTQRLAWPRIDVQKVDPVGVGYSYGWGYGGGYGWRYGFSEYYASTEIPQPIKDAQCELALGYLSGFDDGEQDVMDSFSADGVSVRFRAQRPGGGMPPRVLQLIAELIGGNELRRG